MKIIGIDPGSHRIGYSILERNKSSQNKTIVHSYGTIEITPGVKSPENLIIIKTKLQALLDEFKPEIACVEDIFFSKNVKTAKTVMESRGVILLTLGEASIRILEPTATQIKKGITGNGNSDKKDIKRALKLILGIPELTGHDDAWDAVAAGFVGLAMG